MTPQTPKVSVVIPVYGVEHYIERCARSLFEQTLQEIEFIFIDDCSPDNSQKKIELTLDDYPSRKAWTRIMKLPTNSGQAAVRRQGVIAATGDYVIHCDSDDWVAPDMYEKLYNYAVEGNYDVVWCDYFRSDGDKHTVISQQCGTSKEEIVSAFLRSRLIASVCNRLYKRRLQTLPGFIYPMANMTEDFVISLQLTLNAQRIGYLPEALYYYYVNPSSICMNIDEDKILRNFKGQLQNSEIIFSVLQRAGLNQALKREIECKKCSDKDFLFRLLYKKNIRKLWQRTYPEVNRSILTNPFVGRNTKIRAFCVLFHLFPFYHWLHSKLR